MRVALAIAAVVVVLTGCSPATTAVLTNGTDVPLRAELRRELMQAGERTLVIASIAPRGGATLGPVRAPITERITLEVVPAGVPGAVPAKRELGFGTTRLRVAADPASPSDLVLEPVGSKAE
jgi:hypothetical protein